MLLNLTAMQHNCSIIATRTLGRSALMFKRSTTLVRLVTNASLLYLTLLLLTMTAMNCILLAILLAILLFADHQ